MPVLKICNQAQEISKLEKVLASQKIIDLSFKSNYLQSSAMNNNGPTLKHFETTPFEATFLNLRGWWKDVYWQSYDFAADNRKKMITYRSEKSG